MRAVSLTEVAKGLWMRRNDVKPERLIQYGQPLGNGGAVVRRLRLRARFVQAGAAGRIWNVFDSLSTTYAMLDAMLPAEGAYVSRRPRRVNVSPDELEAVRRT